ncbi:MAG: response regulator [Chloroflexi bacterium]|nr:response regulator [Chloroflexota bacterium]MBI1856418.1 response regulator [Chloroflexota bacterium]MBI3339129.1 response regulator [Chloroflexota bacterium]
MPEKILIVDDDVDTLRLVGLMLQRQGYLITAASSGEQGLAKAFEEKPDIILLDVMMPDMDGYEVSRRLRKNPATKSTPILMFTAKTQLDDKVTGFESGADDYLTKPTHPTELQAHIRALLSRIAPKTAEEMDTASREQHGWVIGMLSARGGLGVSTLASNLAGALFTRTHAEVILAELTPGQGTLGMDLGAPSQSGLNDLLSGTTAEITREKVSSLLVSHSSGLKLLLASENPRDVHLTSKVDQYEIIVSRLSTLARFVVLDLGSGLPAFAQKILPLCSEQIVVIEGALNTIARTKLLIDEIANLGIDRMRINVVLNNRMRSESQIGWTDVQQNLGHSIAATITPAPEMMSASVRIHMPAVFSQPTNVTSQQLFKIADQTLEREKTK